MIYLLDSNACIGHLRTAGGSGVSRRIIELSPGDVALCSVVKAELVYGALRSQRPVENLERVNRFCEQFASLPFDDEAARITAHIRAFLAEQGLPIGPNDLMIAGIAKSRGLTLVTHNTSEFSRVPGLQVEDWEA